MKKCAKCSLTKNIEEFAVNRTRSDGRQTFCKMCKQAHDRAYYADGRRGDWTARKRIRTQKIWDQFFTFLSQQKCQDCGERDMIVLEFDHIGSDKEYNVSAMLQIGLGWNRIKTEIAKCEVVCCNCHRRRTHARMQFSRRLQWGVGELADPPGSGPGDIGGSTPPTPASTSGEFMEPT